MKKDKHMFFLAVVILAGVFIIPACVGSGTPGSGEPDAPWIDTVYVENRKLGISWVAVDNADSYNLYWNTTGGVSTSDNDITGIQASGSRITYYHSGLSMFRAYSYMVTAVNTVGESAPSNEVSEIPSDVPEELLKKTASDAEDGDEFGFSVAISGDYAVVGAHKEDGVGGTDRGAAYVFDRNSGGPDAWGEAVILTASDAEDGDEFGCSVSIGGDFVAVGADHKDGVGTDTGAAYVFDRNQDGTDAWGEAVILTASDAEANDQFGWSVAISSDSVVIGAPYEGDAGVELGAVYVFHRTTGTLWKLTALDAEDGDRFGYSVSISINGDYVVVGAPFADSTGTDLGVLYIF